MCARWGEPTFRGKQIFEWLYRKGEWNPERMTNLPRPLRQRLKDEGLAALPEVTKAAEATDGTAKLLLRFDDHAEIETVLIPQERSGLSRAPTSDGPPRGDETLPVTQCVSSQVGCAMGCVFCASGLAGLKRNLNAAEIVQQVVVGRSRLGPAYRFGGVVLMGMGEPLHNYDEVARALVLMTHPAGLGISRRKITLSTSGLVREIDRLAEDFGGDIQLAISLHATDAETRSELMPINRKYPLADLIACLRRYPLPRRSRITIEYTLIRGVNDSLEHAERLVRLLRGIPVKINLIPVNPVSGSQPVFGKECRAPDRRQVQRFRERVHGFGVSAFVRKTRGEEIDAACGQLALHGARLRRDKRSKPSSAPPA